MELVGQRCKEIIENLLGFSRRPDPSEASKVDLREVIRQALKITELQARSLGVTVEMRWPESPVCVLGHFNLLAQAISHILQNSFEAVSEKLTKSRGFKGEIKIELRQKNDRISLEISDNGVGISPELQNKILNPLFSTKTRERNTGLGLTLAYKIVDEHQGQLEIFSQPKMGTTVKIAFVAV
jgi:two-component system, NtrC family, sensor kinase